MKLSVVTLLASVPARLAALALLVSSALAPASIASPTWQETADLQSWFDNNFTYAGDAASRTGVVTFWNQTATNVGATDERMGMYFGWAWSYDSKDNPTSLPWQNGSNAFAGGPVSLTVERPGFADQSLLLGDVVNDTWIGVPWAPNAEPGIATDATWIVPFFDFGFIGAGQSVTYDVTLTFTFADDASFADWHSSGSMYLGAQGVKAVPETGSILLPLAFVLASLAYLRRRKTI